MERGFGVLQRKFNILVRHMEQWYVEDINDIVLTCVALHNSMVGHRCCEQQREDTSFYMIPEDDRLDEMMQRNTDTEREAVDRRDAEIAALRQIEVELEHDNIIPLYAQQKSQRQFNTARLKYTQKRWEALYDPVEHNRLRQAIIQQLRDNRDDFRAAVQDVHNNGGLADDDDSD